MAAVRQYCPDCNEHTEHSSRWDKERHGRLWTCLECGFQVIYRQGRGARQDREDKASLAQGLPLPARDLAPYMAVSPDGDELTP